MDIYSVESQRLRKENYTADMMSAERGMESSKYDGTATKGHRQSHANYVVVHTVPSFYGWS